MLAGFTTRRAGWDGGRNLSGFSRVGGAAVAVAAAADLFFLAAEDFFALAEVGDVVEKREDCWREVFAKGVSPAVGKSSCRCRCRPALLRSARKRAEEAGIPLGARNWGIEMKEDMAASGTQSRLQLSSLSISFSCLVSLRCCLFPCEVEI